MEQTAGPDARPDDNATVASASRSEVAAAGAVNAICELIRREVERQLDERLASRSD